MLATSKNLSLIEQKKLQWAKEREEMMGLYGLWGRPRSNDTCANDTGSHYIKSNLLPPIKRENEFEKPITEHYRTEEESETSGYLSDSPKHLNEKNPNEELQCPLLREEQLNNEAVREENHHQYWNGLDKSENYWAEKKMFKNYKNENWAHQNSESFVRHNPVSRHSNKNFWYGTPESVSSDDGSRLRWGDRGVGIGHLWEPVVNAPDSRLPRVADPYRQTPKWVEKGLKNADGNKADILIIQHPDDEQYEQPQKNFILGQNAFIPPEVIEEREKKRKKALEHQNAIKKQLEERELKRKQERENKIKEERLEEERIIKEQEIERRRYEEEQRKMKEKEELEKRKEEAMREAIEEAERRAREEKKRNKRHLTDSNSKNYSGNEKTEKLEKIIEQAEMGFINKKNVTNTSRCKAGEKTVKNSLYTKKEQNEKTLKDSSSQFEEIQLAKDFQFLNVNELPLDGGLALMLDNPHKDSNFLLPPDGVQLALIMSPRNPSSTNRLIPATPLIPSSVNTGERTLTPSKYRVLEQIQFNPSNKSTQTDFKFSHNWTKLVGSAGRGRRLNRRSELHSGSSGASQKCKNTDRHHKHNRCFLGSKYRAKPLSSKTRLEDRPKWGINRPSIQYKKQSEKDPYYQKKKKEKLKKTAESILKKEVVIENEKELESVARRFECDTDEEEKLLGGLKNEAVLKNGFRMNSNLSSPIFVPISGRVVSGWSETKKSESESERSRCNNSTSGENEDVNEDEGEAAQPNSVGFLTKAQLESIQQIANLREGLKKLQKDYSTSRSITPFSDKNDFLTKKKEPAQVLDFSKVKITCKEDFKKYLDKIPECKVKPEKIAPETVKIKDKDFSFIGGKKEEKQSREWQYLDPVPPDMKGVKLEDLCPVSIDWKMLTTLRPKTKVEEDLFSRLVQLGKLDLKYQQTLLRQKSSDWIKKTKNPKSSIVELKVLSCKECGEDFCDGFMCSKLMYDNFYRPQPSTSGPSPSLLLAAEKEEKKKKRKKKKRKKKGRKRSPSKGRATKKLGKNSIFNRPTSRGCNRDHSRRTVEVKKNPRPRRALSSTRSFSTTRVQTGFFEKRSKSAPRIHFECIPDSKNIRYELTSYSELEHTDYSSKSESDSPSFHRRFVSTRLSLSGKRKLLSARVGLTKRYVRGSSTEGSQSRFIRNCTLYKGYHSDTSITAGHNYDDDDGDSFSSESSSACYRSVSTSPERIYPRVSTSAKHPSTIQIQFESSFEQPGLRFPEKMILPSRISLTKKERFTLKQEVAAVNNFSKNKSQLDENFMNCSKLVPVRPKTGASARTSRPRTTNSSKFSGSYLKTKGLFGKKSD